MGKVPNDLTEYYDYMITHRLSKDEQHASERELIFDIVRCGEGISVRELFLALQLATVDDLRKLTASFPSDLDQAKRRLKMRCGPLIELRSSMVADFTTDIRDQSELHQRDRDPHLIRHIPQFLHQTAKTWSFKKQYHAAIVSKEMDTNTCSKPSYIQHLGMTGIGKAM